MDDIVVRYHSQYMLRDDDIDNRIEQLTQDLREVNLTAHRIQTELDDLVTIKRERKQQRGGIAVSNDQSNNTSGGSTIVVGDAVVITDTYGGYYQRSGIVQRVTPCYLFIDLGEIEGPYLVQKHKQNVERLSEQRKQAIALRVKTARKERNRIIREKKKQVVRIREETEHVRRERDRQQHWHNNARSGSDDSEQST